MRRTTPPQAALLLLGALALGACRSHQAPQMSTPELPIITAQSADIPLHHTFVGRTYGERDLLIQPRVEGTLTHIYFREGSYIVQGTPLYQIEPATYRAEVKQRRAELAEAEATLIEARKNYQRIRPLAGISATSRSTLDEAVGELERARAALQQSKAALKQSTIEESYTQITAPCSGIIGRTLAKRGDLVGIGTAHSELNTISQIEQIQVRFYLPATLYNELTAGKRPLQMEQITLSLSDRSTYPNPGKLDFVGRAVESGSGAFEVQASFPNPNHTLRPGEFARIDAIVDTLYNAVLIPQRAVIQSQNLFMVWTLDSLSRASQRIITPAQTQGAEWVISSGLHSGDRIITEGFHKLHEGATVKPIAATAQHTASTPKQ